MICYSGLVSRLFWTGWTTLSATRMGWSATSTCSCLMIAISCCLNCTTLSCLNCTTLCCLWIFLLCWCCAALLAREGSLLRRRGSFEKKWPRGDTWKMTKTARDCMQEIFFFYWTVLHIQFHLAWQLIQILQTNCIWCWTCRDSQHVGLAPNRHTICNTLLKNFTQKILQDWTLATSGLCSLFTIK